MSKRLLRGTGRSPAQHYFQRLQTKVPVPDVEKHRTNRDMTLKKKALLEIGYLGAAVAGFQTVLVSQP